MKQYRNDDEWWADIKRALAEALRQQKLAAIRAKGRT